MSEGHVPSGHFARKTFVLAGAVVYVGMGMPNGWHSGWVGLSIVIALSCRSKVRDTEGASRAPDLAASATKESERAKDDLWRRASGDDPVDLARLADREGVAGLLEGLEEGGAIGLVALAALPFADDAEGALQRLGEIARQIDPSQSGPVLVAVTAITARPRRPTEPVDAPGLRSCGEAVLTIARNDVVAKPVRARAVTALRLLAERGAVDPKTIPADTDAR